VPTSLLVRDDQRWLESVAYHDTRSMDCEQHSRAMTGWEHVYEQVGREPFRGRLTELLLGPIQVALEQVDNPMRYRGAMRRRHIVFSSMLPTDGSTVCSGRPLVANTVVKFPKDYAHTAHANGPIKFVSVAVEEGVLADYVSAQTDGAISRKAVLEALCVVDHEVVARFRDCTLNVLEQGACESGLVDNEFWRADTKLTLLQLLLELIEIAVDAPRQLPPASTRAYIVEKAIAYMKAHLTDPFTISSVAQGVRVSPRTLRYSFEEILGVSPRCYLSALRLQRVRCELCGHGQAHSIQRIAQEYGFWHLGRFAQYYREAFGELPSDTCRRTAIERMSS